LLKGQYAQYIPSTLHQHFAFIVTTLELRQAREAVLPSGVLTTKTRGKSEEKDNEHPRGELL
jgi:hypothetical protein